jgi:1,2-diacylglycerol 3-alpha-glucosyltransferase
VTESPPAPRVVMVHDYPPMSGGGLALAARDLTRVLGDRFDVSICSSRLVDHFADDRADAQAVAARLRWQSIVASDCAIVHWTFSFRWLSTLALACFPLTRRRTVCVVHTAPDHCLYNRLGVLPPTLRRSAVATAARLMARCDEVIALSQSHACALRGAGVPVTKILPLPVARHLAPTEQARTALKAPVTVGIAGELSRLKGSDDLPGLLAVLLPECNIVIAGRGPSLAALLATIGGLPSKARSAVTVTDRLAPQQMASFYAGIDCLLLCSRTESQSRVVLEAMLAGVLVLARPTTGVEDLVLDGLTGFLIDPANPCTVRDRLHLLLQQPDLASAVRGAARERANDVVLRAERDWVDLLETLTGL